MLLSISFAISASDSLGVSGIGSLPCGAQDPLPDPRTRETLSQSPLDYRRVRVLPKHADLSVLDLPDVREGS